MQSHPALDTTASPEAAADVHRCPVCTGQDVTIFIEVPQVPVLCNVLWPDQRQALEAPRGDLKLGFCRHCGHIFNYAFDPARMTYTQAYENSLHFSPRFQQYAHTLAEDLIARYRLHGKQVIDIGCGKGDFLRLLCEKGANRGFGFDPSYEPELAEEGNEDAFTIIRDLYTDQYADYQADLVCCRHVLEHVEEPRAFINRVRRAIGHRRSTAVFFEVPNVRATLRDLAIWDLIYEHCSYFSEASLSHLFAAAGFAVQGVRETFGRQYLCIEALPGIPGAEETGETVKVARQTLAEEVGRFGRRYDRKVASWQAVLDEVRKTGKRAVIWGAGSKGVTILNMLQAREEIPYAVDINPRKQGKYIAGTGQKVVSPAFLCSYRPDVIILMNSIYEDEVRRIVRDLDLAPTILTA